MNNYPHSPRFIEIPNNKFWARVTRCGSASIEWAIKNLYHPEITITDPLDKTIPLWRWQMPKIPTPTGDIYIVVRDPIKRFISACYLYQINDIDNAINSLTSGEFNIFVNISIAQEFRIQSDWILPNLTYHYYDFDNNGPQNLANDLGLGTLLTLNKSNPQNPLILTDNQIGLLQSYYAKDIALYNSIKSSNN